MGATVAADPGRGPASCTARPAAAPPLREHRTRKGRDAWCVPPLPTVVRPYFTGVKSRAPMKSGLRTGAAKGSWAVLS
ncbi:hypothetical protein ACM9HC_29240, partial [Streptomyces sp. JAC18]|uniref:hypothetical protein n=1 Tax=unclassified Streptomyces TaxID=2593676 RepID=UPI003D81B179